MTNTLPLEIKQASDDDYQSLHEFILDLIDICNKHRVWISIGTFGRLRVEPVEGKLLDVAGFYHDDKNKITLPAFVDRLSGDEK